MLSYRNENDYLREPAQQPMHSTHLYETQKKTLQYVRRKQKLKRRLIAFGILFVTISSGMMYKQALLDSTLEMKINEKERLFEELQALKQEGTELEEEIDRLQDPDYIAKIARRDYFLSKEGEIIFQLNEKDR